jgi:hypothetical protein
MRGLWRKRRGSGGRFIRCGSTPSFRSFVSFIHSFFPPFPLPTYSLPTLPSFTPFFFRPRTHLLLSLANTHPQALQLLEYLIKNGSERTVDDARAHVGTIKMLRNFHYIDEKGKDQGINGKPSFPFLSFPLPLFLFSKITNPTILSQSATAPEK